MNGRPVRIRNPDQAPLNHRTRHERRLCGLFTRSTLGKSMETSTIRFACSGRQMRGCQAAGFAACKMLQKDDDLGVARRRMKLRIFKETWCRYDIVIAACFSTSQRGASCSAL